MKTITIFCRNDGTPREVSVSNASRVTLCTSCQYKKKSEYNSAYIKKRREAKKALPVQPAGHVSVDPPEVPPKLEL